MVKIFNFDEGLRSIFSYAFRVIILAYAFYLLANSENFFSWYVYSFAAIFYYGLFIYLKGKEWSMFRMINDFLFILLIIYEKDFNNPAALIFILLPIINSPNHSGRSSSPFTLTILSFLLLGYLIRNTSYFTSNKINLVLYFLMPSLVLLAIVGFEVFRSKLVRLAESFNHQIDNYYSDNLKFAEKPYIILERISKLINNNKLLNFKTERLVCFKLSKSKMTLIASSKFVFQYRISDRQAFIERLRKDGVLMNAVVSIDGRVYERNISYLTESNESEYIFLLITDRNTHIFYHALKPVFIRLSKIFDFEHSLNEQKSKYSEKLKYKMEAMDDAQMAMHFIKNKLTPITNFLAMVEEYRVDAPPKELWLQYFVKEMDKSRINIPLIVEKTRSFHKDVENIFSLSGYEAVSVIKLIGQTRSNWTNYFSDEDIQIEINMTETDAYKVVNNEDLFEVLLTNWISNMSKYNNGVCMLKIYETMNSVELLFRNNVAVEAQSSAERFISDFNAEGKSEIQSRVKSQGQGLRELRYLIRDMELPVWMVYKDGFVEFNLTFRKQ